MVTLVINPGSSSKKYALYSDDRLLLTVRFEQTGEGVGRTTEITGQQKTSDETTQRAYHESLHELLTQAKSAGVIASLADITAVGVRVVAPGHMFAKHRVVDDQFLHDLKVAERVAPLHVGPTMEELVAAQKLLKHTKLIAVSDSAFHQTVPEFRTKYSLKGTAERGIRKFGYHGISAASVSRLSAAALPTGVERIIVAHIGSGVSIIAVDKGQSVHTSMGYTPASGLMMGTRAGEIDPGALITFLESESLSGQNAHKYIQTNGGFKGLVGNSDIRQILLLEERDDTAAKEAMKTFLEQVQMSIAKAHIALGGAQALVLTATSMERNPELRARVVAGLRPLGFWLSDVLNDRVDAAPFLISDEGSLPIAIVPTDEMGEMARVVTEVAS